MSRLPVVNGDTGAWGTILNDFLSVSLNPDGTLKNLLTGAGSPEGVVTATPGQVYIRTDGGIGTVRYIKETGSGNTGWLPISNYAVTNPQSGTAYTLALTDIGKIIEMSNAAANTVTVPPEASVLFPIGTMIDVCQYGAGQSRIVAGAGVTINTPHGLKLAAQFSVCSLRKRSTNEWILSGDTMV